MNRKVSNPTEQIWRHYLETGRPPHEKSVTRRVYHAFKQFSTRMPKEPQCRTCASPFHGIGGLLVGNVAGIKPSKMNPILCNICERFASENEGGAEIELSMMFLNFRGSPRLQLPHSR